MLPALFDSEESSGRQRLRDDPTKEHEALMAARVASLRRLQGDYTEQARTLRAAADRAEAARAGAVVRAWLGEIARGERARRAGANVQLLNLRTAGRPSTPCASVGELLRQVLK